MVAIRVVLPSLLLQIFLPLSNAEDEGGMWAKLYSGPSGTGDELYTQDYLPDLSPFGFDDKATSVCGAGVWLLYENHNYSPGIGEATPILAEDQCTDLPSEVSAKVTSIRQAGSPIQANRSSLTLYAYTKYRGPELYLTRDWPDLDIFNDESYSAIVTGDEPWTVYTYEDYLGMVTCLIPDQEVTIGGQKVGVGLFPTYQELGSSGEIRSARKGCE